MIAFLSSLQNLLDFFPAVADGHVLKFSNVERVGNDGDFVNVAVALKGFHGMFDHHLAGYFEELFRCGESQTASYSSG